jgi:hypothetical protein
MTESKDHATAAIVVLAVVGAAGPVQKIWRSPTAGARSAGPVHVGAHKEANPSKPSASVVRIEIARDVAQTTDNGERQHRI